jgi:hypothetical protein
MLRRPRTLSAGTRRDPSKKHSGLTNPPWGRLGRNVRRRPKPIGVGECDNLPTRLYDFRVFDPRPRPIFRPSCRDPRRVRKSRGSTSLPSRRRVVASDVQPLFFRAPLEPTSIDTEGRVSGQTPSEHHPYAVVLATGGTASTALALGFPRLATVLLVAAALQAACIPLAAVRRCRRLPRWASIDEMGRRPAELYPGLFTIPLGLSALVSTLVLRDRGVGGTFVPTLAVALLSIIWLQTAVLFFGFVRSLYKNGIPWERISGAWFLVPAAFLGGSVSTLDVVSSPRSGWDGFGLVGALAGWLLYLLVLGLAGRRLRRYGREGVPQAPWWIAAGCGGLAALALGRAQTWEGLNPALRGGLVSLAAATDLVALVLWIPILLSSARFLLTRCRFRHRAVWSPAFSSCVLALGSLLTAALLHAPALKALGEIIGVEALLFWLAATAWECVVLARTVLDRGRRPTGGRDS